jgi:pimeloyl-ACP methyl ester carboxylesterase
MITAAPLAIPRGVRAYDLDVAGIRTQIYEVDPSNNCTPLVLLHGAGVDSALVSFGSTLAPLGKHRRVIAVDLPGYGDTEFADSSYSVPWYAAWVADLIRALGLARIHLGGLSLGGWITLEVAISRPDIVFRVIPINPGGVSEKLQYQRTATWLANHPGWNARIYKWTANMGRRLTRLQLRRAAVMHASVLTDDLIDAVIINGRRPHAGEAFACTQRWALTGGPQTWSLVSRLPRVGAKTLVIAGRADKLVPVADSVRAAQLVRDGDVRVFDRCGHWLVRDCPFEFVDAVHTFLGVT